MCKFIWFSLILASKIQRWNPDSSLLGPVPAPALPSDAAFCLQ